MLARRGVAWKQTIEVNSLDLIHTYVMDGFGYGLSLIVPDAPLPAGLKLLPLNCYSSLIASPFWMGKMAPITQAFADEMQKYVGVLLSP